MSDPVHPQLRRAVETRLRQRLDEYAGSLDDAAREQDQPSAGLFARGQLVAKWTRLFEQHCERAQADLVAFQAETDDSGARAWVAARYSEHVDSAVRRTVLKLADNPVPGLSTTAVSTRFQNLAAAVKARSTADLESGIHSTARRADTAGDDGEPLAIEMDDRLPLRRRAMFDRDLAEMVASASPDQPLGLIMIDLDHFKGVNDQHGHPAGDEVLLDVARLLVKRVGGKGRAYRYGGEELALLLATYSSEEAWGLAERLRKDLEGASLSSKALSLTASFGVASAPSQGTDARALLEQADRALYAAKAAGRNCVRSAEEAGEDASGKEGEPCTS